MIGDWDLVVSYYGDDKTLFVSEEYSRIDCKGSKWNGLSKFFMSDAIDWKSYRYVWCPDDDLDATCVGINQFFEICDSIKVELAQPALDWSSFWSHSITLQNTSFRYRTTNFVEVMAPCFSTQFLARVVPTFAENNSGWGLEWLWQQYLGNDNFLGSCIVDSTSIIHTRPVGSADRGVGNSVSPVTELELLQKKYNFPLSEPVNKGGCRTNCRWIDIENNKYEFIYRLSIGHFRRKSGLNTILNRFPRLLALIYVLRACLSLSPVRGYEVR